MASWPSDLSPTVVRYLEARSITPKEWSGYSKNRKSELTQEANRSEFVRQPAEKPATGKASAKPPAKPSAASNQATGKPVTAPKKPVLTDAELRILRKAGYDENTIRRITPQTKAGYLADAQKKIEEQRGSDLGLREEEGSQQVIVGRRPYKSYKDAEVAGGSPQPANDTKSKTDLLAEPFGWDEAQIRALQDQLVQAGLLARGTFVPGEYDAATRAGYYKSIDEAYLSDRTPNEVLTDRAAKGAGKLTGRQGATFSPSPFTPKPDEEIVNGIRTGFQNEYGRDPTPEEVAKQRNIYRAVEKSAYDQATAYQRREFDTQNATAEGQTDAYMTAPTIQTPADPRTQTETSLHDTPEARQWRVGMGLYAVMKQLQSGGI